MEAIMQKQVDNVLELFDVIKQKVSDEQTASILLQEICKDKRSAEMRQERESKNDNAVTDRQKEFMKKLGIKLPKNITKQEASALIDEELKAE
jgi:carbamoylphosphate synthase large subunit